VSELQRLLRDADPIASEPPPGDLELAQMRQLVLERASFGPGTVGLRPAWAFGAAGLLLMVAAIHQLGDVPLIPDTPPSEREPVPDRGMQPVALPATNVRQIYFTAPGGTRVFWLLERDIEGEATP
jgi:hypothetical protein